MENSYNPVNEFFIDRYGKVPPAMELHERLVYARKNAGFETAADAAAALGVNYQTYAGHENGNSGFRADKGELYARRFKVRFEWLMRGKGPMIDSGARQAEVVGLYDQLPPDLQDAYLNVLRGLVEKARRDGPPKDPQSEGP